MAGRAAIRRDSTRHAAPDSYPCAEPASLPVRAGLAAGRQQQDTYPWGHLGCLLCRCGIQWLIGVPFAVLQRFFPPVGSGWEPPELAERHRERQAARRARAPLFDPRLGPGVAAVLAGRKPGETSRPVRPGLPSPPAGYRSGAALPQSSV
ncbi:MAG TPA: hypothetical protein VE733_09820 [Streptosporangiaceae bacterium]|nr:hypothetical protein [Streptosporangiaceae bacterium]